MKQYDLQINIEDGKVLSHEKTSGGLTSDELLLVLGAIEEVKMALLLAIMQRRQIIDKKDTKEV